MNFRGVQFAPHRHQCVSVTVCSTLNRTSVRYRQWTEAETDERYGTYQTLAVMDSRRDPSIKDARNGTRIVELHKNETEQRYMDVVIQTDSTGYLYVTTNNISTNGKKKKKPQSCTSVKKKKLESTSIHISLYINISNPLTPVSESITRVSLGESTAFQKQAIGNKSYSSSYLNSSHPSSSQFAQSTLTLAAPFHKILFCNSKSVKSIQGHSAVISFRPTFPKHLCS